LNIPSERSMMQRILPLAALSLVLITSKTATPGTRTPDEPLLPPTFVPAKPPDPKTDAVNVQYQGTVTEVTKDSITIQWPGDQKAKKFSISETLASGGFTAKSRGGSTLRPRFCYRLGDVKVGDQVYIRFAHLGDADICDQICINKRPD